MIASSQHSGMPAHGGQPLDWKINQTRKLAPHNGATDSFDYIFPVSKYCEAFTYGTPSYGNYINYLNYNHGNQPYDWRDSGLNVGFRTPRLPNWYSLSKVSPKSSMAGIQLAQQQIANLLQPAPMNPPIGSQIKFP